MSNETNPGDDDVRRTLAADAAVPPGDLDDRIRSAARDALVRERQAQPARPRRWRVPAGIGVAASVLLAVGLTVLVVERGSGPVLETAPDVRDAQIANDADEEQYARAAPEQLARPDASLATAPAPAASPSASPPAVARLEESAASPRQAFRFLSKLQGLGHGTVTDDGPRTDPVASCEDSAAAATTDRFAVCITAAHIELRETAPGGCAEPLRLIREPGEVTMRQDGDRIDVFVDASTEALPRWRVRCVDGAWQVEMP